MAGYKTATLGLNPKLLLTFDGDPFDPINRNLTAIPLHIIDESGNGNDGILQVDSSGEQSYRLGDPSLVAQEQFDQYSIQLAPTSPNSGATLYPKTFVEIPHSVSFAFPSNGSFSTVFHVRKTAEIEFWNRYLTGFKRIFLQKGAAFSIWVDNSFSPTTGRINVTTPNGDTLFYNLPSTFWGNTHQIAFTWSVVTGISSLFTGKATLFIDGHIVASGTYNYFDAPPVTNVSNSFEFGGTAAASDTTHQNDRQTSSTWFDQLMVFDYALTNNQVGYLFKKTYSYGSMILSGSPLMFFPMSEVASSFGNVMQNSVTTSGVTGNYHGNNFSQIVSRVPGPTNIPASLATKFAGGGTAAITNASNTPVFNLATDYTVEFWAISLTTIKQATIFSMISQTTPYFGPTLEVNTLNNSYSAGVIQFSGSEYGYINAVAPATDGFWHHYCLIKRSGILELWMDGVLLGSTADPYTSSTIGPNQIYLFGGVGGNEGDGSMADFAVYQYALQSHEIKSHFTYAAMYRITGEVTLAAIPYQANIRVYRHLTGEKVTEVQSDTLSGLYQVTLFNNDQVDIVVLNMQDPNVRYRVYGPISPSEYEDLP